MPGGGWNVELRKPPGPLVRCDEVRRRHVDAAVVSSGYDTLLEKTRLQEELIGTLREQVRVLEKEVQATTAPPQATPPRADPPTSGAADAVALNVMSATPRTKMRGMRRSPQRTPHAKRVHADPMAASPLSVIAASCDITPRTKLKQKREAREASRSKSSSQSRSKGQGELAADLIAQHGSLRAAYTNLVALCAPTLTPKQLFQLSPQRERCEAEAAGADDEREVQPSYLQPEALHSFAAFKAAVEGSTGPGVVGGDKVDRGLLELQVEQRRVERLIQTRRKRQREQVAALQAEIDREQREAQMLQKLIEERG